MKRDKLKFSSIYIKMSHGSKKNTTQSLLSSGIVRKRLKVEFLPRNLLINSSMVLPLKLSRLNKTLQEIMINWL